MKKFSYAVPRQGGNCTIDDDVFKSFEFLQDFSEMKIIAVRIVSSLNDSQQLSELLQGLKVSTMAVDQELSNIACSINTYGVDTRFEILVKYNRFNKHSLVGYNVGLHLDIFDSNSASFENKIVLNIKSKKRNNTPWEISRGGGKDTSMYCIALLDWGIGESRRTNAIHHNIITAQERVSQNCFRQYFANNPHGLVFYKAN